MNDKNFLKFKSLQKQSPLLIITEKRKNSFWYKYFSKKTNIVLFGAFLLFLLFIFLSLIFYKQSPYKPVIHSFELAKNLPKSSKPTIEKSIPIGPEYDVIKDIIEHSSRKILIQETHSFGFVLIKYNAYELLYGALELANIPFKPFYLVLGTNNQGVDNFAIIIHSFGLTILTSILSLLISITIGSLVGSIIAYYSEKNTSKISFYILSSLSILPYVVVSFILFSFFKFSNFKAILIFSTLSSINFIYTSYASGLELKTKSFIDADRVAGFNNWHIIIKNMYKHSWWNNIVLISDQLSIIFLSLTSLAFFNVPYIDIHLNIGLAFKQLISDISNYDYLWCLLLTSIIYIVLTKWISISLYITSNPKLK